LYSTDPTIPAAASSDTPGRTAAGISATNSAVVANATAVSPTTDAPTPVRSTNRSAPATAKPAAVTHGRHPDQRQHQTDRSQADREFVVVSHLRQLADGGDVPFEPTDASHEQPIQQQERGALHRSNGPIEETPQVAAVAARTTR
jgi:hypothetical protein